MHVRRLGICAKLPGYEFVVPDHVRHEIRDADQRNMFDHAVHRGEFRVVSITNLNSISLFAELTAHLGRGEAACLALAVEHGWTVASDERKRFRRETESRIGEARLIGTKELYLLAIGAGVLDVDQADADKAVLEQHRFKMSFKSFRDLVT